VPAPGDYDDGEIGGMIGRGNRSTRRKPAPVPLCPPQTPHANPGRRGGKPATNRLGYGTAFSLFGVGCISQLHRPHRAILWTWEACRRMSWTPRGVLPVKWNVTRLGSTFPESSSQYSQELANWILSWSKKKFVSISSHSISHRSVIISSNLNPDFQSSLFHSPFRTKQTSTAVTLYSGGAGLASRQLHRLS
jgi:hypothetical protein